jgi:hypothetical protein
MITELQNRDDAPPKQLAVKFIRSYLVPRYGFYAEGDVEAFPVPFARHLIGRSIVVAKDFEGRRI